MIEIESLRGHEPVEVVLKFVGDPNLGNPTQVEPAVFLGLNGEGEKARAKFRSMAEGEPVEWEAYRFERKWAFGTSAEQLILLRTV